MSAVAEATRASTDRELVRSMVAECLRGWYIGDQATLKRYGAVRDVASQNEPELSIRLLLTRDRMHHSVGWWRNAEYEYCWHLSMSACDRLELAADRVTHYEDLPEADVRHWAALIFGEHANKVWHEPGGTDPRLSRQESIDRAKLVHLRLFLDPETFEPFVPKGEVYDLTRWIPGLTPEKADR